MKRLLALSFSVVLLLAWGLTAPAADDPARTADGLALGPGTVRDTISYTGDAPGWTVYFRPGVRFSNHDRLVTYFDFLVPLYATDKSVLFFNPKANFDNIENVEWNVGVGYRHLLANDRLIVGGNLFYDGRESYTHNDYHQIGIGAEVLAEWVSGRINGYISLSDAQETDRWREYYLGSTSLNYSWAYRLEEPMSGLDYEIGFKFPGLSNYVETWVYGGGYNYFSDYTDDMAGWSARVEVIPTDFVRLNFTVRDDNLRDTEYAGEVTLELPFSIENLVAGKDPFEGLGDVFTGSRTMKERLYEQVRRDVDITINTMSITRETYPGEVIPGETIPVCYVSPSGTASGTGALDDPCELQDALDVGGDIYILSGTYTAMTPYIMGVAGTNLFSIPGVTDIPQIIGSPMTGLSAVTPLAITASNTSISGLYLEGRHGLGIGLDYAGGFYDVSNITVSDTTMYGFFDGVYVRSSTGGFSSNLTFTNDVIYGKPNTANNRGSWGLYFYNPVENVLVEGCTIVANGVGSHPNSWVAYSLGAGNGIHNGVFRNNEIYAYGETGHTPYGMYSRAVAFDDLGEVALPAGWTDAYTNILFENNYFYADGAEYTLGVTGYDWRGGQGLNFWNGVVITGNTFEMNSNQYNGAIDSDGSRSLNTVSGNTYTYPSGTGTDEYWYLP